MLLVPELRRVERVCVRMKPSEISHQHLSSIFLNFALCGDCRIIYPACANMNYPCPGCGRLIGTTRLWPELHKIPVYLDLIQAIYFAHSKRHEDSSLADDWLDHRLSIPIFFCSLGEVLLAGLLAELSRAVGLPAAGMKQLLTETKGSGRRTKELFLKLSGRNWGEVLAEIGPSGQEIWRFYQNVRSVRHELLHDPHRFSLDPDLPAKYVDQTPGLIRLFVVIHNLTVPKIQAMRLKLIAA